ncbi:MAG: sensor histidine kinase [Actinomycetota bacterium]
MTSTFASSVHFASHLLALIAALAALLVFARDQERRLISRVAGVLGFAALAAAEAFHGAEFGDDEATLGVILRTAAYAALFGGTLLGAARSKLAATAFFPAQGSTAAFAALAAALAAFWTGRHRPNEVRLATGLALMGGAEALLGLQTEAEWAVTGYHVLRTAGYAALVWYVVPVTRRSIQFRFAIGFVGLLLAIVLGISSVVAEVVARNQRGEALARVLGKAETVEQGLIDLASSTVPVLTTVGETFSHSLEERRPFPQEEMDVIKDRLFAEVDFILFMDPNRRVLGAAGVDAGEAIELAGTPVVQQARSFGRETASLTEQGATGLAYVGAAPIMERDQLIGLAAAGFVVDEGLLGLVARGSRAAIFRGPNPVPVAARGFPGWAPNEPLTTAPVIEDAWREFLTEGRPIQQTVPVGGLQSFAAMTPLRASDFEPVAILLVTEPTSEFLAPRGAPVNRTLFLATVGVIAGALVLAALIARRITRPIRLLTRAARRVQYGDLGVKADVGGEDEVGELAASFNQMTSSLETMTGELREAADEQSRLRGRLETVLDSMGDGLIAADPGGRVVTYNPAAEDIIGLSRTEVVGRRVADVLRLRAIDGQTAEDGVLPAGMAFLERRAGERVPVAVTSSPMRDASGAVTGHVYVLRDMSREHEIERMKSEFLSNVSHELRTPLTPIVGYSEMLAGKDVGEARAKEFATGILQSARRLERIVGMVVDYAAIEGGRMSVSRESASIRQLVLDAVDTWENRSGKHRITSRIASGVPKVHIDVGLVRRALDELLDNAVKYSPNGGTVRVSVELDASDAREMVAVEVTDEGIGIEPEHLPRVFLDFRQVDASDTRKFGGLGLGLAFVKRIVEAHGGAIGINSHPGAGTTLRFTLPPADSGGGRRARTG